MQARERAIERLKNATQRREALTIRGADSRHLTWTDERHQISTRDFDSIDSIDPDERVATVQSGVSLAALHTELTAQRLMFPAAFPAGVLRALDLPGFAEGTIGGLFSDPRESAAFPQRGRVRDHILGVEAIRGDGTPFKAGGRVVKNVTGYDLTRLLCGARGRLGLVTRLHLRLDSLPECVLVSRLGYADDAELFDAIASLRITGREPLILAVHPNGDDSSDRWTVVLADAGRRGVAYLQLGRLLERLSREPIGEITELTGEDAADPDGDPPHASSSRSSPTLSPRIRIRLPFRRWSGFIRALPLTRLAVVWETIFPFAHFGVARLTGDYPERRRMDLEGVRRLATEHGGSVVLESRPSDWEPNDDPLSDGSAASTILLRQVGQAWDPAGVLWTRNGTRP